MPSLDTTNLAAQVDRARSRLDDGAIADLLAGMTAIRSPTGEERALATYLAGHLADAQVTAEVQAIAGDQANLVARVPGSDDGLSVMLYAPLDTAFAADSDEDGPFLGDEPRPDFALPPRREGSAVIGLGAENPKAFAAAAVATVEAIAQAGVGPRGDVVLGLASGSMPVDRRPGVDRAPLGWGSGIRRILEAGPRPDFAVILKPGYAVAHEEVGLAWYRITVRGAVNYTGIRHKGPYRNPIVHAARLIGELESWFAEYATRHADDIVLPQGSVNAIRAGSADRASFIPATCEIDLDLRVAPGVRLEAVDAELEEVLDKVRRDEPDVEIESTRRFALPGSHTDPDAWIVRSLIRAWEAREGTAHAPATRTSGASDAAIIREAGVQAARIGLPPPSTPNPYPGFSMGYADATSVRRLAEVLIDSVLDTTCRTRTEVGLT